MAPPRDELRRPSGVQLPLFLRKKWLEEQKGEQGVEKSDSKQKESEELPLHPQPQDKKEARHVFTSEELEDRFYRVSAAMLEVQRQLYRGEEVYHEETYAHGNLSKGFDVGFIDAPLHNSAPGGNRRMPADHRWFSNSCPSISRISRPSNFFAKPTIQTVRSETNTPVALETAVPAVSGNVQVQPHVPVTGSLPTSVTGSIQVPIAPAPIPSTVANEEGALTTDATTAAAPKTSETLEKMTKTETEATPVRRNTRKRRASGEP
jgi:hypothetical protein